MSKDAAVLRRELESLELGKNWYWFFLAGVIMLIGGAIALAKPFAASMTVEMIVGWTFIGAAIINAVQIFTSKNTKSRVWSLILGVIALLLGTSLLNNPLAGLMSLTMVVGMLVGLSGVSKMIYGFSIRPTIGWLWLVISGLVSIVLAVLIFSNFGGAALVTLGIMLAIELISSGILLVLIGFSLKKLKQA